MLLTKIHHSLHAAREIYHQLVLLVGEAGSGKTAMLHKVADFYGTRVINVNLALSTALLELTPRQRPLRMQGIFEDCLRNIPDEAIIKAEHQGTRFLAPAPVILDNLEILFDKDLRQDPLRMLQSASRNRVVLASWNGTVKSGMLQYAEPGHPEYRSCSSAQLLIVTMDEAATVDSILPNGEE